MIRPLWQLLLKLLALASYSATSKMKFWRALVAICAAFVVSSLQGCGDSEDDNTTAAMDNTTTMMTETTTMMP